MTDTFRNKAGIPAAEDIFQDNASERTGIASGPQDKPYRPGDRR